MSHEETMCTVQLSVYLLVAYVYYHLVMNISLKISSLICAINIINMTNNNIVENIVKTVS